jgi:hypothetical protein
MSQTEKKRGLAPAPVSRPSRDSTERRVPLSKRAGYFLFLPLFWSFGRHVGEFPFCKSVVRVLL